MDKRTNNGGARQGAGRKGKAEEQKLIENLTPMNDKALESLQSGLEKKEQWAVKLFFEYFYGKPQQRVDVTSNDESINMPLINFVETDTE
tara:strand:- start:472 stop:741 length:270 start_codon:yes stop_codon:yes gene_type:complete